MKRVLNRTKSAETFSRSTKKLQDLLSQKCRLLIFVEVAKGVRLGLDVTSETTVETVKDKTLARAGTRPAQLIDSKGMVLQSGSLRQNSVGNGDVVYVAWTIHVATADNKRLLLVMRADASIDALREQVEKKAGVVVTRIVDGQDRVLRDGTLRSNQVEDGSTVYVPWTINVMAAGRLLVLIVRPVDPIATVAAQVADKTSRSVAITLCEFCSRFQSLLVLMT
jgi:hypothetical protein